MRTRTRTAAAAALPLLVLQACGSSPGGSGSPSPTPTQGATSSAPTGPVTVTLVLSQTSVRAGQPIHGTLSIDNTTGHRIPSDCGVKWAVGIESDAIPYRPAFTLECQMNASLKAGITVLPVTVITTYNFCSQSGRPDGTTPGCLPGPTGAGSIYTVAPPLPRGTYRTSIVSSGLPAEDLRLPRPLAVTLS